MGFILSQEAAGLVAIRTVQLLVQHPHAAGWGWPRDGCSQAKRTGKLTGGGTLEEGGGVRVTAFPCSWTTRLHKDSMMVDSDTIGQAVSAIYMYIYIGIFIDIYRMSQEQYHRGAQVFTNITSGCVSSPLQQTKSQMKGTGFGAGGAAVKSQNSCPGRLGMGGPRGVGGIWLEVEGGPGALRTGRTCLTRSAGSWRESQERTGERKGRRAGKEEQPPPAEAGG